jgi:hypothetical protein
MAARSSGGLGQGKEPDALTRASLFQHAASFLGQGATGAIVVIEADVDGRHFRVKRIADTDDSKVCEVHLT